MLTRHADHVVDIITAAHIPAETGTSSKATGLSTPPLTQGNAV